MSEVMPTTRNPEKSPVLITGASGFLGKYATAEFLDHGYSVKASGRNEDALAKLAAPGVELIPASLEQLSTIEADVESVVHAAARSDLWGSWEDFYDSNVAGTQHVIDFCQLNDVKRLVYVSSPSIYSDKRDRYDIEESDYDPANSLSYYIKSKIMAEQLLQDAYVEERINELVILRPRGLLGVGDPSMIPRILHANETIGIPLFSDGQNMVDLTCVENVAVALRLAVEAGPARGDVYNITNDEPAPFKSLLDELYSAMGETPRYRAMNIKVMYSIAAAIEKLYMVTGQKNEPPLTRYTVNTLGYSQTLDISKAKLDLGYEPVVSMSEGIARFADDYRERHGRE